MDPPLQFSRICDLLDVLEKLYNRYHAPGTKLLLRNFRQERRETLRRWVDQHRPLLNDAATVCAVLSLLLPQVRTDRVYYLSEKKTMVTAARKAMGMGKRGEERMMQWRENEGELGLCLEKEMALRVHSLLNTLLISGPDR